MNQDPLDQLRDQVRQHPADAALRAELGEALLGRGEYADAESVLGECVRLDPENPFYHALHGRALLALGRHAEAAAAFGNALTCGSGAPYGHGGLGRALAEQGKHAEAEAAFRAAARLDPADASYLAGLGSALAEQAKYDEAEAVLRQASTLDPENPGYAAHLGAVLASQGRHADAEASFRSALALDAKEPAYHADLGRALAQQGRHTEAEAAFRAAVGLDPGRAAPHAGLGQALLGQDRYGQAEQEFQTAIELDPECAAAWAGRAAVLAHEGRYAEAETAFQRAVRIDPGNPAYQADLGRAQSAQGFAVRAEVALRRAVRAARGNPAYRADLGRALLSQRRLTEAEEELREAVRLAPDDPSVRADLGQVMLDLGRYAAAEELFLAAFQRERGNPSYRAGLGRALSAQGKYHQAEQHFRELVRNHQAAEYRAELGRTYLKQGRNPEAQRMFSEAIRLEPDNPEHRALLGRTLVREGQHLAAQRWFKEAIALNPGRAAYHAELGGALDTLGELTAAEAALREAVRLDPDHPAYQADLGRVLLSQQRYDAAVEALQGSVRRNPDSARSQADLGRALYGRGYHTAAEGAFRTAVRLDPAVAGYLAGLGQSLRAQERYAEAESAFREAIGLNQADAGCHAGLGESLHAQQRYAEAETAFSTAVRLDPAEFGHKAALGRIHTARGQLRWAEDTLAELLGSDADAAGAAAASLQQALSEAYDEKIVAYASELAEQTSEPVGLSRRGVDRREYQAHVPQIARAQLANLRVPYRAWSDARRSEESELQHIRSSARSYWLKIILMWSLPIVALAALAWIIVGGPGVLAEGTRRIAEIIALGIAVAGAFWPAAYSWRNRSETPRSSRASLVLEDQFATLVTNLVLKPAATAALQINWKDSAIDRVIVRDGAELSAKAERDNLILTDAHSRLSTALSRLHGSAVALAGPRGSGKTELARALTDLGPREPPSRKIALMLWAPAKCDPHTFLLRLLKELCMKIAGSGSPAECARLLHPGRRHRVNPGTMAAAALVGIGLIILVARVAGARISVLIPVLPGCVLVLAGIMVFLLTSSPRRARPDGDAPIRWPTIDRAIELLMRIEFTETRTRDAQLGITGYGLTASAAEGSQYARVPLSEIDVVRELDALAQSVETDGWQIVVAIDELDKMADADEAMAFLNHIKVLFSIHNCSFIVSVSEDAWARYENRGLPLRDTFDSSFDEVLFLDMLNPLESRDFLKRRSNSVTDTQTLLCHCLSGGLPRDLLRAARLLARVAGQVQGNEESGPPRLCDVLPRLLEEDLGEKLRASEIRARADRGNGPRPAQWPGIWRDPANTEAQLAAICRAQDGCADAASLATGASAASGAAEDCVLATDYLAAYIAVLHTVRQAFAAAGPLGQLSQAGPDGARLLAGFQALARARWQLASDIGRAWELLHEARAILGLAALRPALARSVPARDTESGAA